MKIVNETFGYDTISIYPAIWAEAQFSYKIACAPSEDSDLPVHTVYVLKFRTPKRLTK